MKDLRSSKANSYTLLVDADDTLWENSVYFERVIQDFASLMEEFGQVQDHVRLTLDEVERKNTVCNGYGAENFIRSLKETFVRLAGNRSDSQVYFDRIDRYRDLIWNHPVELLDGVEQCLQQLSARHQVILFTKGNEKEQRRKIGLSGLSAYFHAVEIVREKNASTYQELIVRRQLNPDVTWMVGNSPRSDINPAIAAGLSAVFIPHPKTWLLEHETLMNSEKIRTLRRFAELLEHF